MVGEICRRILVYSLRVVCLVFVLGMPGTIVGLGRLDFRIYYQLCIEVCSIAWQIAQVLSFQVFTLLYVALKQTGSFSKRLKKMFFNLKYSFPHFHDF